MKDARAVALSALFLSYEAVAGIILLFWLIAIGLTIWLSQLISDDR